MREMLVESWPLSLKQLRLALEIRPLSKHEDLSRREHFLKGRL